MHVITRKRLKDFWERYPDSEEPLRRWYAIVSKTGFQTFAELRAVLASADKVKDFTVFNISGNKYRLVAAIHFNRQKPFIRHVFTHAEYDDWSAQ